MAKQDPKTETVDFRFVLTDRPGSPRILAAKWLRSHKSEVLDFLVRGMKHEIAADNGATPQQIQGAKVESAAFFEYMAKALSSQIAIDRGELPAITEIPAMGQAPVQPKTPATEIEDDDEDDWDDDDEIQISLPPGMK